MPGLMRGMARTAVIAGTATAVSNRVSRRQAERWSQEDQSAYAQQSTAEPAYDAPQGPSTDDKIDQLAKLGQLRDSGVLTQAEFEVQKEKVLAG